MHSSQQRIASSLRRCIHTGSLIPSGPRLGLAHRQFHGAVPCQLPRRRSFFTSNVLLQQDGSESPTAGVGADGTRKIRDEDVTSGAGAPPPATAKRKPRGAGGPKSSLRRVAAIAQQPTAAEDDALATSEGHRSIIRAVCAAESFDMEKVMDILQAHGFSLDPDGTGFESHEVVHARGASQGDVFVFESGTIVAWSLPPDAVTRLATRLLRPAAVDPLPDRRRETEDLEFMLDPSRDKSTIRGDVVVLGSRRDAAADDRLDTTLTKIAFSSGLARSTKLAALETSFTEYFESTRRIPTLLSQGAQLTLSKRFILRKTGELLSLRAQLNHYRELTDSLPDIFWDSRYELGLENYYDQVGRALDVNVRIDTLNKKMDYAQEIASVLREVSSERHATRLEWIIIVLIAVEVVFELRRVFLERHTEKEGSGVDVVKAM